MVGKIRDRPPLPHFGPAFARILKQQMIKGRAFDLKSRRLLRVTAVAENQFQCLARISNVKLRAHFLWKTVSLERFQNSQFFKKFAVIGQKRLSNVEAREVFLLKNKNAFARPRQQRRGSAA